MQAVIATEGTWSLGVLIGLPVALFLTAVCSAAYAGLRAHGHSLGPNHYDYGLVRWLARGALAVGVVVVVVTGIALYPFSAEYHKWVPTSGVVAAIEKRIVGGDNISEKFVVRFTDGRERGCTDTRCAAVKRGDYLALTCKRVWQYTGTDGYDCNYVERRAP